jgi:beta-lactamase class A
MLTRRRFTTTAFATMGALSTSGCWLAPAFSTETKPGGLPNTFDKVPIVPSGSKLGGLSDIFSRLEAESGGRLGVAVLDTASGDIVGHRQDEPFPMCSTFKLLCAAAVLSRVDAGKEQLARRIPVGSADILDYAPVTKQHAGGEMTVAELCEAMVTMSDNTAANLLLTSLGGPSVITQYARGLGDSVTRLDRTEPELNSADAGDPRDSTTPAAMARNLQTLTLGLALLPASRDQLNAWLVGCKTGDARLRAGLPKDWRIGDKTGSGAHGTRNDVAVVWPAGHPPVMIAVYLTQTSGDEDKRNAIFAAIGKAVATAITG